MPNNLRKPSQTKESEIAKLLVEGTPAAELVQQGYARGTVYKVAGRMKKNGSSSPVDSNPFSSPVDPHLDPALETDPEIIKLRKAVRKAELDKQLLQITGQPDLSSRIIFLESQIVDLANTVLSLEARLDASPLEGLRHQFECECGAKGLVAATIQCTACGDETSYGWFPGE